MTPAVTVAVALALLGAALWALDQVNKLLSLEKNLRDSKIIQRFRGHVRSLLRRFGLTSATAESSLRVDVLRLLKSHHHERAATAIAVADTESREGLRQRVTELVSGRERRRLVKAIEHAPDEVLLAGPASNLPLHRKLYGIVGAGLNRSEGEAVLTSYLDTPEGRTDGEAMHALAQYHRRAQAPDLALKVALQATLLEDHVWSARGYLDAGQALVLLQKLTEARRAFESALHVAELAGADEIVAQCAGNLATVDGILGGDLLPGAHVNAIRCLAKNAELERDRGVVNGAILLGYILIVRGEVAAAEPLLTSGLALARKQARDDAMAHCLKGLACVCMRDGASTRARVLLLRARESYRKAGTAEGESACLKLLAINEMIASDLSAATNWLEDWDRSSATKVEPPSVQATSDRLSLMADAFRSPKNLVDAGLERA